MTYLNVRQVADKLSLKPNTVRQYAASGKISGYRHKNHGNWLFIQADVDLYIKENYTFKTRFIPESQSHTKDLTREEIIKKTNEFRDRNIAEQRERTA